MLETGKTFEYLTHVRHDTTIISITKDSYGIGSIELSNDDAKDLFDLFRDMIDGWNAKRQQQKPNTLTSGSASRDVGKG